jgi:hypothetical protein
MGGAGSWMHHFASGCNRKNFFAGGKCDISNLFIMIYGNPACGDAPEFVA